MFSLKKFVMEFSAKQQRVLKTRHIHVAPLIGSIKLLQFVNLCALLYLLAVSNFYIIKQMKRPEAVYCPVMQISRHLRTLAKCKKHTPVTHLPQVLKGQ